MPVLYTGKTHFKGQHAGDNRKVLQKTRMSLSHLPASSPTLVSGGQGPLEATLGHYEREFLPRLFMSVAKLRSKHLKIHHIVGEDDYKVRRYGKHRGTF